MRTCLFACGSRSAQIYFCAAHIFHVGAGKTQEQKVEEVQKKSKRTMLLTAFGESEVCKKYTKDQRRSTDMQQLTHNENKSFKKQIKQMNLFPRYEKRKKSKKIIFEILNKPIYSDCVSRTKSDNRKQTAQHLQRSFSPLSLYLLPRLGCCLFFFLPKGLIVSGPHAAHMKCTYPCLPVSFSCQWNPDQTSLRDGSERHTKCVRCPRIY